MRRFTCHRCGAPVAFEWSSCTSCEAQLGYEPASRLVVVLEPTGSVTYTSASVLGPVQRCLNFAWGCNWVLPASPNDVWCVSCRLTRGRPDHTHANAVEVWRRAEQVKRRLVHQLLCLGLPISPPSPQHPGGVVFDLVHLPESRGVTGHRPGVVTIDLREADDAYREATRLQLGEPDRTVLGHLRHEIGHHYWGLLVADSGGLDEFRSLFGDERADYAAALERHYAVAGRPVPAEYITGYAAAHPSEDWAESVAHYLHLRDGLETADAYEVDTDGRTASRVSFAADLDRWRRLTEAVNELSVGLGHVAPYPYVITAPIARKLDFVHRRLLAFAARGPTHATECGPTPTSS